MHRALPLALLLTGCASGPAADDDDATEEPTPEETPLPDWCPEPADGVQDVRDTDASPYLIQHAASAKAPTLVFLPGGYGTGGDTGHATGTWQAFFTADLEVLSEWRIVMPYVDSGSFVDDVLRTHAVTDEVRTCFGADVVHLGGSSNGGNGAFAVMLDDSSRYSNLATMPGCIADYDPEAHVAALEGRAVLNGVGANDKAGWHNCVESSHDFLVAQGIDSTHRAYLNVEHVPPPGWTGVADMLEFLATP